MAYCDPDQTGRLGDGEGEPDKEGREGEARRKGGKEGRGKGAIGRRDRRFPRGKGKQGECKGERG